MAGGRRPLGFGRLVHPPAAMEPRPDGRGKRFTLDVKPLKSGKPQWSPGLMAGGRTTCLCARQSCCMRRNGAPA